MVPVTAKKEHTTNKDQSKTLAFVDMLPPYILRWHASGNIAAMEYEKQDPKRLYMKVFRVNKKMAEQGAKFKK
jgi:hypothetical protein